MAYPWLGLVCLNPRIRPRPSTAVPLHQAVAVYELTARAAAPTAGVGRAVPAAGFEPRSRHAPRGRAPPTVRPRLPRPGPVFVYRLPVFTGMERSARRPCPRLRCAAASPRALMDGCWSRPARRRPADEPRRAAPLSAASPKARLLFREALVSALWDAFPVSEGHALIVSTRRRRGVVRGDPGRADGPDGVHRAGPDLLRRRSSPRRLQHRVQRRGGGGPDGLPPARPRHPALRGRRPRPARRRPPRHPGEGKLPRPAGRLGRTAWPGRQRPLVRRRRRPASCRTCWRTWTPGRRVDMAVAFVLESGVAAPRPTSATCSPAAAGSAS